MAVAFADIAFTPNVRAEQSRMGSGAYGRLLDDTRQGGDRLGAAEATFITARDGFYQATVSETGWPYVQFRGGPAGFLKVLDDKTIAYEDLRGNRQYLSLGNLRGNDRVALILMDYPNARRLKIWGRVTVTEQSETHTDRAAKSDAERLVKIEVEAFDWNCPRHIPRRLTAAEAGLELEALEAENAALRDELRALKGAVDQN